MSYGPSVPLPAAGLAADFFPWRCTAFFVLPAGLDVPVGAVAAAVGGLAVLVEAAACLRT